MIVRARDGDDLRAGDIADRAGRDDRALAFHQARDRGDGAKGARVRELDRAAGEVIGQQAVGARLFDQRLVGRVERGEIHRLGVLDHRHDEGPAAVLLFHVDGEAQADRARVNAVRLAIDFLEGVRHHREALGGLHNAVTDQVRERDLLPACGELRVDGLASGVERGSRDVAERGRGRDGQRVRHVGDEPGGGAGYRCRTRGRGDGGRGKGTPGHGRRVPRPASLFPRSLGRNDRQLRQLPVVEQLPPLLPDGGGVAQVVLVHGLYEGGVVGTEDEFAHGLESTRYLK